MIQKFIQFIQSVNPIKAALIFGSVLVSFVLIILNNSGVLPLALGDFIFFSGLVFLFALYRPGWAFLFFIGLLPFEIVSVAPREIGALLRPYQWVGVLTLAATLTRFFGGRLPFALPKVRKLDVALLIFWIGSLIAAVSGAPDRGISIKQSIVALSFIALYALVRIFIRTVLDVKNSINFFVGSGVVVALYALWQNIRFGNGANAFEVMAGRPNSVFTEADWLGAFLVVCIGALYAVIFLLWKRERSETDLVPRPFVLAISYSILALLYMALIISVARSAWLAAMCMTIVAFAAVLMDGKAFSYEEWKWQEGLKYAGGIGATFAVSLVMVFVFQLTSFQLFNRVQSTASGLQQITVACEKNVELPDTIGSVEELEAYACRHIDLEDREELEQSGMVIQEVHRTDPNVNIRKDIYAKTFSVIREHFVTGIGFGSSASFLGQDERGAGLNSSNIFLEVWLGSGLLGLAAFMFVWLFIGYISAMRVMKIGLSEDLFTVYLFIFASWIGLTVFNLFNAGIFLGFLWVWLAVAISFVQKK